LVTLSIDANVFIDLIRGRRPQVRERFQLALASAETLVASLIVFHELRYGAAIQARPAAQLNNLRWVLEGIGIEPFDEHDMTMAADIRATLKRRGTPIGPYDVLIAGQALARGWTVVTANNGEFARVEGLTVIDWTAPAD
jgi:tRNA(fMet)-specific endonuclease VapC